MTGSVRILVTGGAGFIGSHLVGALVEKGIRVRVVDDLSSGSMENLEPWLSDGKIELVQGDLKSPDVVVKSVKGVDVVCHLAANPDVRLGETEPSAHFNENLLATFNVLEAMRGDEGAKRLVFASTSTVYGEADELPTPEDYGPLLPISVYGASKLGCEALIASYCHTFGLGGAVLRFANVVGSRAAHGVIIDFIKKLRQNPRELEILGDGRQEKSYLHVCDLISAFDIAMDGLEDKSVDVYNVGSVDRIDVVRVAELVCETLGIERAAFRFNDALKNGRGWKGDVKVMQLSVEKLLKLGWRPKCNSEEAVRLSCRELSSGL